MGVASGCGEQEAGVASGHSCQLSEMKFRDGSCG